MQERERERERERDYFFLFELSQFCCSHVPEHFFAYFIKGLARNDSSVVFHLRVNQSVSKTGHENLP